MQLVNGVGDFVVGGIKVRRDTDARAGTKVDEDLATNQFGGNLASIRNIEDDGAAADRGVDAGYGPLGPPHLRER